MEKSEIIMSQPAPRDTAPLGSNLAGNTAGEPYSGEPKGKVGDEDLLLPGDKMTASPTLGSESCTVVCPACHKTVQTDARPKGSLWAECCSLLCTAICCVAFCLLCIEGKHVKCHPNWFEDDDTVKHYCPSCEAFIGTYNG